MKAIGGPGGGFRADRAGWELLFATIDARDAQGFVRFLTPQAQFRFGNAPAVNGRPAIAAAVASFFASIAASRHEPLAHWEGPASAVCEGRVTYTVPSGTRVAVPFVNVFDLAQGLIASYRIYIDLGPLFAALS